MSATSCARAPARPLAALVTRLWSSAGRRTHGSVIERVVPTGHVHVVFRLGDEPLRLYPHGPDRSPERLEGPVVGGARVRAHLRSVERPVPSVGALLRPGAVRALLGASASELTGRHILLEDLWGRAAGELAGRLREAETHDDRLRLLEEALLARAIEARTVVPDRRAAFAAARLSAGARVGDVAAALGESPRRFGAHFEEAVGLSPKRFSRVVRAGEALALGARRPELSWTAVASRVGYVDLSHLHRELRAIAGVTPSELRALSPASAHHLPLIGR